MKKLLFLFLLISISFAQNKVRWYDLTEQVKDSIRFSYGSNADIGDTATVLRHESLQWQILAPTVAYGKGDSLLFVYSSADENVYYDLGRILSTYNSLITIDSIWIFVKGDTASHVDSLKILSVNTESTDSLTTKYTYSTKLHCTVVVQTLSCPVNSTFTASQPLLLRIWYDVTSYIYTIRFRIFATAS